jgi:nicotinamidase-related amidase
MFCSNTPLAVIYADITESPESSDSNTLIKDIRALEKAIWKHSTQKYLGIFTLKEGKVAEPFAEFAAFHASTETGWIAEEPGVFGPALQERLRSNGTTHLLFVGYEVAAAALEAKKQGFQVCIFKGSFAWLHRALQKVLYQGFQFGAA